MLSGIRCHAGRNIPMFSSATVIFRVGMLYWYYCVHMCAPLDRILNQTNPLNITKFSFLKIYVNIILPYRPVYHNVAGGFRFWHQCSRGLCSSGVWHRVTGWPVPDGSRQPGGLIFQGRKIKRRTEVCSTGLPSIEDVTTTLYWNVDHKSPSDANIFFSFLHVFQSNCQPLLSNFPVMLHVKNVTSL